jgi:hypothetical protein
MSDSDPDPDPKDELGARFDERTPGDDEEDDTDASTASTISSERGPQDVESSGESETGTSGDEDTEWVRVQFRVPKDIRTDLNEIGYAKLMMELRERGIGGKEKRELQHAAVQMLLDNPGVWADTVEELDDP